jgi:hypothetical protein
LKTLSSEKNIGIAPNNIVTTDFILKKIPRHFTTRG